MPAECPTVPIPCYFCKVFPNKNTEFRRVGSSFVLSCGLCIRNFRLECTNPICTDLISVEESSWGKIKTGSLMPALCSECERADFHKCKQCKHLFRRTSGILPYHLSEVFCPPTGYVTKVEGEYLCDRCIQYCQTCKIPGSYLDRCQRCSHPSTENGRVNGKRRKLQQDPINRKDPGTLSPEYTVNSPEYHMYE